MAGVCWGQEYRLTYDNQYAYLDGVKFYAYGWFNDAGINNPYRIIKATFSPAKDRVLVVVKTQNIIVFDIVYINPYKNATIQHENYDEPFVFFECQVKGRYPINFKKEKIQDVVWSGFNAITVTSTVGKTTYEVYTQFIKTGYFRNGVIDDSYTDYPTFELLNTTPFDADPECYIVKYRGTEAQKKDFYTKIARYTDSRLLKVKFISR